MRTYPSIPGVPAAGHVTARGGYWHPGRAEGCAKCEPYDPPRRDRRRQPQPRTVPPSSDDRRRR